MAATAKMSHPNNSKKFGNMPQDCFTGAAVDHDMHLKMSKKIAQLTKVIYALNTKNDEHEHIVKTLQLQHDKEKQQLMSETKSKVEHFKSKVGTENELRMKIESLEQSIDQHAKQKKQVLQELESFKRQSSERERTIQQEHNHRLASMDKELTTLQKNFTEKLDKFEFLVKAFEKDKEITMDELKKAHQLELDNLVKSKSSQSEDEIAQIKQLKAQHANEIMRLQNIYDELLKEKQTSELDFEEKYSQAKALYEKELDVLRNSQSQMFDSEVKQLQDKHDKLLKDFQFQEAQYRRRIDGLLDDLSTAEEKISKLNTELAELSMRDSSNSQDLTQLRNQFEAAKKEAETARAACSEADRELQVLRQHCTDQSNELSKKAGLLSELTTTKSKNEYTIRQLEDELSNIKSYLQRLQDEKEMLQSKTATEAKEKSKEVQALERALEDLRIEKLAQRDKYEVDIASLEKKLVEESNKADQYLKKQLEDLRNLHSSELSSVRETELDARKLLEEKWSEKHDEEKNRLKMQNTEMKEKLEREIHDLTQKLNAAEDEIKQLQKMIGDTNNGLGEVTSELNSLRDQSMSLRKQLDKATAELKSSKTYAMTLQNDVQELKSTNTKLIEDHQMELKTKLDDLNKSLETSWMQKLRNECQRLRAELEQQHMTDKQTAIRLLNESKDQEIERLQRESQLKLDQLHAKISQLQKVIDQERMSSSSKVDDVERQYAQQIQELLNQIDTLTKEYEQKIKDIENRLNEEWTDKMTMQDKNAEERLLSLKSKHVEDMQAQMTAHRSAVDMIQREAESIRKQDMQRQEQEHFEEKAMLRNDLATKHQHEMEVTNQGFTKQLTATRMELQRAIELRNQKDKELQSAAEEMGEKISLRERTINNLEHTINKLQQSIDQLNKEIEMKGKEMLNIRSDANKKLRQQEQSLAQQHAEDIETLSSKHSEDLQQMLGDFTKAQHILKDKINELSSMLEEAEERYRNRESRDEDLRMIGQLKAQLAAKENEMQQLLLDKQYYQLELVNRETNFTKVFSGGKPGHGQPQVGFINPLAKKKKGEKGPTKYAVSAPALDAMITSTQSSANHKLRPIAGSPIHDERLNPNQVLPPPQTFTKKFVQ